MSQKIKVFGEWIAVEKIYETATALDKTGIFKNKVKILGIGESVNNPNRLKIDDIILIAGGTTDIFGESFISEQQILRWI